MPSSRLLSTLVVFTLVASALVSVARAQTPTVGEPIDYSSPPIFGYAAISGYGTIATGTFAYGDGAGAATSHYSSVNVVGELNLHAGCSINDLSLGGFSTFFGSGFKMVVIF